jgi:hypothetical protein
MSDHGREGDTMRATRKVLVAAVAALGALGLVAAPAARAEQDLTFQVPVKVQNLHPDVKSISVGCKVLPAGVFGRADVPVVGNAYNKTVSVKLKMADSQWAEAKTYHCALYLMPASGNGWTPTQGPGVAEAQAKAGTPFVPAVEGPVFPKGPTVAPQFVPRLPAQLGR